jgi:hypothetical protein
MRRYCGTRAPFETLAIARFPRWSWQLKGDRFPELTKSEKRKTKIPNRQT